MSLTDNRRVALIKSVHTKNRFYALVTPESGIKNAEMVDAIPKDLHLGIAYPCLEDGLNDFAVIRTTYETLEYFPEDDEMRGELMDIINESRANLTRRLEELRERIAAKKAHFLGTDLNEFKSYAMDIINRGYPRRNLDNMMKLNVFGSVAQAEGHAEGEEPLYRYEFNVRRDREADAQMPAREFIAVLFNDVLESTLDDANYKSKYLFDRNVFQKFIALMFVNYATTDPIFYGTNRADYGVSGEKDMETTPLYVAVARELREIEQELAGEPGAEPALYDAPFAVPGAEESPFAVPGGRLEDAGPVELPGTLVNEDVLLGPISTICSIAEAITRQPDHESAEFGRIILGEASKLVQELKRLNLLSPFAYDPGAKHGESGGRPDRSQDGPAS